jgi:hypothetical protein
VTWAREPPYTVAMTWIDLAIAQEARAWTVARGCRRGEIRGVKKDLVDLAKSFMSPG